MSEFLCALSEEAFINLRKNTKEWFDGEDSSGNPISQHILKPCMLSFKKDDSEPFYRVNVICEQPEIKKLYDHIVSSPSACDLTSEELIKFREKIVPLRSTCCDSAIYFEEFKSGKIETNRNILCSYRNICCSSCKRELSYEGLSKNSDKLQ